MQVSQTSPQNVPEAIPPKKARYRWWRVLIWLVLSFGLLYLSSFMPLQSGEDSNSSVVARNCNCTTHYVGFPLPWIHVGVDAYVEQSLLPRAYAQVRIPEGVGSCLPGCSGILGMNSFAMAINFILYLSALIAIDVYAVKKKSKKPYLLLGVILLVFVLVGAMVPGSELIADDMRL